MNPVEVVLVKHPFGERYKAKNRRPRKVSKLPRPGKGFEYFYNKNKTFSCLYVSSDSALYFLKRNNRDVVCVHHNKKYKLPCGLSRPYASYFRFSMNQQVKGEGVQPHITEQGGPEAQTSGNTQLVADASTVEVKPLHVVPVDLHLKPRNRLDIDYIRNWFAQPFNLTRGTLSATDNANTFSFLNFPSSCFDTYHIEKIKGFRYWRGDAVFTIQVNASKFACGIYKFAYTPGFGRQTDANMLAWRESHNFTSMQRSQLPGVVIDIARETSATFRIPYVAPCTATPITGSLDLNYDLGTIQLVPFSPYNVGAGQDSTCGYTIWVHYENVELFVKSFPSSGVPASSAEQRSKNIGPIQSVATGLRDTAVALTAIPALTPFAAPAAFYSDIVAKVSSTFGWSKPANLDVDYKTVRDVMYNSNHFNSSDNSRVLALDEKNQVEILPGFAGTDVDELNFEVFLSRPSLIENFIWPVSATSPSTLAQIVVAPNISRFDSIGLVQAESMTPLAYMCNLFQLYRGDIIYKFQFVTTTMHSGRIQFAFNPSSGDNPVGLNTYTSLYAYRKIVDLRETNEVIIAMPFSSYSQYRPTKPIGARRVDSIGTISVTVVDELVAPDTAPQTIEVLVWAWAAPGFEFAVPKANVLSPTFGVDVVVTPQSGVFDSEWIGGSDSIKDDSCLAARTCIGERITSLRQLLRVARPMQRTDVTYVGDSALFRPFVIPSTHHESDVTTLSPYKADLYAQITSMFAMSRGGLRMKMIPYNTTNPPYKSFIVLKQYRHDNGSGTNDLSIYQTGPSYLGTNNNEANIITGANIIYTDMNTRYGFEVTVPYYSEFTCRSNAHLVEIPLFNRKATDSEMGSSDYLVWNRNAEDYIIMRSGADDFNLGMFISIPPFFSSEESPIA